MRIAMLHQPWNPAVPPVEIGSIAIWTYETCNRLANNHDVTVYARDVKGIAAETEFENVLYKRLSIWPAPFGLSGRALESILGKSGLPQFAQSTFYAGFCRRAARDIASGGFDVVHVHNMVTFPREIRALNPTVKIVLHMHCEWLSQLPPTLTRTFLESVDRVVACSRYLANTVNDHVRLKGTECGVVYNGVNIDKFYPELATIEGQMPRREILFVGRISPEKGLHVLIDAFKDVKRHVPDATLRIVGPYSLTPFNFLVQTSSDPQVQALSKYYESDYFATLKGMAGDFLGNSIIFEGHVQHGQLPSYYRRAAVLANPSLSESFGMSLIEALASGCPVVCSTAGGMLEIIDDGRTGLLVPPDDREALTGALVSLLSDVDRSTMMSHEARSEAETRFSWPKIERQTANIYDELVGFGGEKHEGVA